VAGFDDVIHQPVRLKVMAALAALPAGEGLEFTALKALTAVTDGNLGTHLAMLERSGYVELVKDFNGKRPRTRAFLKPDGRRAFEHHVAELRSILDASLPPKAPSRRGR
jgi:DNA-binding MarR family transcriptional regulator